MEIFLWDAIDLMIMRSSIDWRLKVENRGYTRLVLVLRKAWNLSFSGVTYD